MSSEKQKAYRREMFAAHNAMLEKLVGLCPATFAPRGKACWPLKIGIHVDIAALLPDASERDIALFLTAYTSQRRYHLAIKEGAPRLDLSGKTAGEVTSAEAAHAAKMIEKSDAKAKKAREPKPAPVKTVAKATEKPVEAKKPEPAKTVADEVYGDVQSLVNALIANSNDQLKSTDPMSLTMTPAAIRALSATNAEGKTVSELIRLSYPKLEIKASATKPAKASAKRPIVVETKPKRRPIPAPYAVHKTA